MRFIGSLLFMIYMAVSALTAGLIVFVFFFMPFRFKWAVCWGWCRSMVIAGDWLCGLKVDVEGRDNLPDEPCVIMIKHTTTLETYWHVTEFPRTSWVIKREILWFPLFGWAIAWLFKPIAINRKAGRSAVRQVIGQGSERLRDGLWVTIFPEGTRMPATETRRYGTSGAALAIESGARIIPVAHNAGDFWPRRGFLKQPGQVRIRIGEPIDVSGMQPRDANLKVQYWIESQMLEISDKYRERYGNTHPLVGRDWVDEEFLKSQSDPTG